MHAPPESSRQLSEGASPRQPDSLDRAIISRLQADGRRPFRAIARELGVAEGTVRQRVARLQDEGTLQILAFANPFPLGYAVQADVLVRTTPAAHADVAETVATWPEVMYLSSCSGSADLYMQIVCKDHDEMYSLLNRRLGTVDGVIGTETFTELEVHKARYQYPGLAEEPHLRVG